MREKHSQLPSPVELKDILEQEAKRPITTAKKKQHFVDSLVFERLLETYDSRLALLSAREFSFEQEILEESENQLKKLIRTVVSAEPAPNQLEALNNAYDYLAEEDEAEPADFIFVFGSKQRFRMDKAIELFRKGMASHIFISGNRPHYETDSESEADSHRRYALSQGISEDQIMIETSSISLPDNVKSSLNLLDLSGISYSKMILVNSPFAQRRGWAYFSKFSPDATKFFRVNSDTSERFSRKGWYKEFDSAKIVLNEFVKMKLGVLLNTA